MNTAIRPLAATFVLLASLAAVSPAAAALCPKGMTRVGSTCIDNWEDQAWRVPDASGANAGLVKKIRLGKVTVADLQAAGATQLGAPNNDFAPCDGQGRNCADVFAVTLPNVLPSRWPSWFQASEACANSGKRLPTNAEWQTAANGTPGGGLDNDSTTCNSDFFTIVNTASRSDCVSARGLFDMAGNLREWVADWAPAANACPGWGAGNSQTMCFAGANDAVPHPAALLRGGGFFDDAGAGPLAVDATNSPETVYHANGFRCAR